MSTLGFASRFSTRRSRRWLIGSLVFAMLAATVMATPAAGQPVASMTDRARQSVQLNAAAAAQQGTSLLTTPDGRWQLFRIRQDGTIEHRVLTEHVPGPVEELGTGFRGAPTAIREESSGRIDLYAVTIDGRILKRSNSSGGWGSWSATGLTGFAGPIAATFDVAGTVHLFGTTTAGRVVQRRQLLGQLWTPHEDLGGPILGNIALLFDRLAGRYDLFVVGSDGRLRQKFFQQRSWSPWTIMPGSNFEGGVSAAAVTGTVLRVLAIGTDHRPRELHGGSTWTAPRVLGGTGIGWPSAAGSGWSARYLMIGSNSRPYTRVVGTSCSGWVIADATQQIHPVDTANTYSIAVLPDTQQEVLAGSDPRFAQRTNWLVSHRTALDLQFVGHTGDVVNWGWLAPQQYAIAGGAGSPVDPDRPLSPDASHS